MGCGSLLFPAKPENDRGKEKTKMCIRDSGVGSALLEYAQGTGDWDAVVTAFVDGWKTEYDAAHAE